MGRLVPMRLKVIKPPFALEAMCVYRFTLDTGYFYYGATVDLADRISYHLKMYREKRHAKTIMIAMDAATSIKFEFVRFVNERSNLKKWEDYFLFKNVGLEKCLNTQERSFETHVRGFPLEKVVKIDRKTGSILSTYASLLEAATNNGMKMSAVFTNCNAKYPSAATYFRKLDQFGKIITPAQPRNKNVAASKIVRQYDKKMNFIKEYESMSSAARAIGGERKNISNVIRGMQKTTMGFTFRLTDENGNIIEPIYQKHKPKRRKPTLSFQKTPTKPVCKMDLNGNVLETYRSIYMAVKTTKIERKTFSRILKKNSAYKGYAYKYA